MTQKSEAPLIGKNFSGPPENAPRKSSLQSKEEAPTEEKEPEKESEKKPNINPKKLTAADKAELYKKNLEELDIPIEKAREIMDEVITHNTYVHTTYIGKLKIGLRTRVYQDLQRLLSILEEEGPSFPIHTDDVVSRCNVAASLAFYGDRVFDFPDIEKVTPEDVTAAYGERISFLLSRPIAVINRLIEETIKFDDMISAIFAEGAPEDF